MTAYQFPVVAMLTAQESNRNAQRVVSAGAENAEGQQKNRTPSRPSAQDYGVFCKKCGHASRYHISVGGRSKRCNAMVHVGYFEEKKRLCGCNKFEESRTFKVSPAAQTAADTGDAHAMPDVPLAAQSASPDFYPPERRIRDRQLADHLQFMEGE